MYDMTVTVLSVLYDMHHLIHNNYYPCFTDEGWRNKRRSDLLMFTFKRQRWDSNPCHWALTSVIFATFLKTF